MTAPPGGTRDATLDGAIVRANAVRRAMITRHDGRHERALLPPRPDTLWMLNPSDTGRRVTRARTAPTASWRDR